jgi:spore coat polysaccharide biosynthesis protein SpsF (cytidylyltransferase family)
MKKGIIVQVRMSSSRLSGKVLRPLAGKVMLQYLLEGLSQCKLSDTIIVATSVEPEDDKIVHFCKTNGVKCFRGSLLDITGRFVSVVDEYDLDAVVRICGDSPLLDYRLVDRAISLFDEGDFDLVTNAWPRTYPYGQSVEVIKGETLRAIASFMTDSQEKEHVTRFIYRNQEKYRIMNFTSPVSFKGVEMTVDTLEGALLIERLIKSMDKPHWEYDVAELVGLLKEIEHAKA